MLVLASEIESELERLFLDFAGKLAEPVRLWFAQDSSTLPEGPTFLIGNPVWNDEGVQRCLHRHREAGMLEYVETEMPQNIDHPSYKMVIVKPVMDAVEEAAQSIPDQELLLKHYKNFRTAQMSETVEWQVSLPLLNFEFASDLEISETLRLEPFTPGARARLSHSLYSTGGMSALTILNHAKVRLTAVHQQRKKTGYPSQFINNSMFESEQFLTALRLQCRGPIGLGGCYIRGPFGLQIGGEAWLTNFRVRISLPNSVLNPADVSSLMELFSKLLELRVKSIRQLDVALRYFNQSYTRQIPEDKIVDATTALESMLLPGRQRGKSGDMAKLGATALENSKIFKQTQHLLKKIYDVRTSIVHEGKLLHELGENALPPQSEEVLRDLLKLYLHESQTKTLVQINHDLKRKAISKPRHATKR